MKTKSEALKRLRDWLENGDDTLQDEMEDGLEEGGEANAEAAPEKPPEWEEREKPQDVSAPRLESRPIYRLLYRIAAALICASLIGILVFSAVRMPKFGGADTLMDSEVSAFYVENTLEDTGAVNIVTGIILDYRGFDTLGESHVLFMGVCAVLLLLSVRGEKDARKRLAEEAYDRHFEPRHDEILQCAARILTPLTLIFGLYIIFNGHLSPGGGFSGGAVLGAGLILYQNAFGYGKIEKFFTYRTFRFVSLFSLLFYSLAKGYHFFTGANHLENGISPGTAGNIFSAGLLLPLNIVVGCVVACTMYALYTMFRKGDF